MKLFLRLSYLGTAYNGYQVQGDQPTVQRELTRACAELFGTRCDIVGCSRTDSGVHANDFCVTVAKRGTDVLESSIPAKRIPLALNAHLPEDISIKEAMYVSEDFHPRYDVKYKEYVYRIYNSATRSPFEINRAWLYPKPIDHEALLRMQQAAQYYCGTHDFTSFMAQGATVAHAVRTVTYASVQRQGDVIEFRVAADGFLYNMVRIMTGTLIAVGEGKLLPEQIPEIINARDRTQAGMTAPAHGLYLNSVVYASIPKEKL
ncbi:MAG: tRNA pseudouridine(38-40) synthase TruA [Clostridia bacterium]|nr:tRNA pseudouridine(38-40) synthase TruA [Clostridia bacterium]